MMVLCRTEESLYGMRATLKVVIILRNPKKAKRIEAWRKDVERLPKRCMWVDLEIDRDSLTAKTFTAETRFVIVSC